MTTTTDTTTHTTAIITLAAQLYHHLAELSEYPITGTVPAYAELNTAWIEATRLHLHSFLVIHADVLDAEWTEMIAHTATAEAWDAYGA